MSGIADWLCHRDTSIETATGAKESLIRLLMLAETGMPVLAGLFLEITSPVLALTAVSVATALHWDRFRAPLTGMLSTSPTITLK